MVDLPSHDQDYDSDDHGDSKNYYLFRNDLTDSTYKIYNRGLHYVYFLVEARLSKNVLFQRDALTYYEHE